MSKDQRKFDRNDDTHMSLIELAKANEPEAWNVVTHLYTPLIRHWAWKEGVRCPHELDNVNQEVFQRLVNSLSTYQRRKGKTFRGWLRTITRNYIRGNRLGGNLKTIGGSDWNRFIYDVAEDRPSVNSLLDAVSGDSKCGESQLIFRRIMNWVREEYSEQQAAIFTSVVVDQRKASDVAADHGISTNIVYQTKSRILAQIREVFNDLV